MPCKMKTLFILLSAMSLFSCSETKNISTPVPENAGLPLASPGSVGMDTTLLNRMDSNIVASIYPNIHSVLVWKDGKFVWETYYSGRDENWGQDLGVVTHHQDRLHDARSVSKSFVSACIGLAIAQGKIKSVDQTVLSFYPEYRHLDTGLTSSLTIRHLLTMTTGQRWNENVPYSDSTNSEIRMIRSSDPVGYALSQPIEKQPGTEWNYNGGSTQLLASIVEKATGKKIDAFAEEYLFQPLGIDSFEWSKYPGTDLPAAASGLRLTSRDLLKLGILYLDEGRYNGKQLLPQDWVQQSIQQHISRPGPPGIKGFGYGYQFFLAPLPPPGDHIQVAIAIGNGNQRIVIDKTNKMVVVVTAGNYNKWNIMNNSDKLVFDFIYPALK